MRFSDFNIRRGAPAQGINASEGAKSEKPTVTSSSSSIPRHNHPSINLLGSLAVGAGVFVAVAAAPALLIIPLMAGAYGYSATKAADTSKPPQAEAGAGTPPEVEAKAGTPPEVEAKAGTPPEVEARAGAKEAEQEQNRMAVEGLLEAIKANNDKIITDSLQNATGIKF